MFLSVLSSAYQEETLADGSERVVLKIPAVLAPYKAAILPLIKKDGLPEKAREIMAQRDGDRTRCQVRGGINKRRCLPAGRPRGGAWARAGAAAPKQRGACSLLALVPRGARAKQPNRHLQGIGAPVHP
jgi:hypothetical protein